jgi:hypothetical protein
MANVFYGMERSERYLLAYCPDWAGRETINALPYLCSKQVEVIQPVSDRRSFVITTQTMGFLDLDADQLKKHSELPFRPNVELVIPENRAYEFINDRTSHIWAHTLRNARNLLTRLGRALFPFIINPSDFTLDNAYTYVAQVITLLKLQPTAVTQASEVTVFSLSSREDMVQDVKAILTRDGSLDWLMGLFQIWHFTKAFTTLDPKMGRYFPYILLTESPIGKLVGFWYFTSGVVLKVLESPIGKQLGIPDYMFPDSFWRLKGLWFVVGSFWINVNNINP